MGVEYDGSSYSGWQIQQSPRLPTVQEAVQQALGRVADHPVKVYCAGRTDAGVHASGQVIHFDSHAQRPLKAWVKGGNSNLPAGIRLHWAVQVPEDFHARFSALSRRYRYVILNTPVRPALMRNLVTCFQYPLDHELMAQAGRLLLGEHDFSSYRGSYCQSRTAMRRLTRLEVERHGDLVVVDIEANAFLLHMVRNIVGTLFEIGQGKRPPQWAADVLAARDRTQAGDTAPATGLYLVDVGYPAHYGLPRPLPGPDFLRPFLDARITSAHI